MKKLLKNICITVLLAIIISAIFFLSYYIIHKIKEKSVLENFKAKITDLRKEGNYYFKGDYKFEVKKNVEHFQKIEEYSQNGKLVTKLSYWIVTNGNNTYTKDIESYYIGDKVTSINNVEKLYWNSENTDRIHNKSIKDFTYISSLLEPSFPIDLKYEKEEKFNGKKCYVILATNQQEVNPNDEWIYIDKKTFLPIGIKNKEGWLCEIEFKINPTLSESSFEIPDLSTLTKREWDEERRKTIYTAPDGTVTEVEGQYY